MGPGLALDTSLRQGPPEAPGAPLPSAVASHVTSHMLGLPLREADGQTEVQPSHRLHPGRAGLLPVVQCISGIQRHQLPV